MNKDNYIRLLEKENQECFEKAIKTMKDYCCHEIPELNDEINEPLDDLNDLQAGWAADYALYTKEVRLAYGKSDELIRDIRDLQADWAADHAEYRKTLEVIKEQNTQECDLNVRLQGNIHELKKEKYDMGMELEKLKKKILRFNGMAEAQQ